MPASIGTGIGQGACHKSQEYLASKYQDDAPYWVCRKKRYGKDMNWLLEKEFIDAVIDLEETFTNEFCRA